MLQWLRTKSRVVAGVLLAAIIGLGGLSSAVHGGGCHEDECVIATVAHDPSSHGIAAAGAVPDQPVHCILCHWTRSVRPSTEPVHHLARPLGGDRCRPTDIVRAPSQIQAAQPPLRSPPASLHA